MQEAKYSVTLPSEKGSQYDKSALLTIRADHHDELRNSVDAVLGAGTYDRLIARFLSATFAPQATTENPAPASPSLGAAAPEPAAGVPPQPMAAAPAPVPAATAPVQRPPQVTYGPCPACGIGTLVLRRRRDGSGTFIGCSRYRRDGTGCSYIYDQG